MAAADASMAGELGVGTSVITAFRKELTLGVHWTQDASGKVEYTDEGKKEVRKKARVLEPPVPAQEPPPSDTPLQSPSSAFTIWAQEKKDGPECMVTIVKCYPSSHVVKVRTPDNALVDVLVRSNAKLRKGHKLRARQLSDGRWECRQPGLAVLLQ